MPGPGPTYDAFITYSHERDAQLAPVVHRGVERFAKPWYRVRALRVFRDEASLSATPQLWSSIEHALEGSRWLVVLLSRASAESPWVEREIRWWRERRTADRVLLVLTDGELSWDAQRGDFTEASTVPAAVRGWFAEEPRWLDIRQLHEPDELTESRPEVQDAIVTIAATLRAVPKDNLVAKADREHRQTIRLARAAAVTLTALLIIAVLAAVNAVHERNGARQQARVATASALAATSESLRAENLPVAQLLAVRGYRTEATPQTFAALLAANLATPKLERSIPMPGTVRALGSSADGRVVVAGLADGRVMRWVRGQGKPTEILDLSQSVDQVATSRVGGRVVAKAVNRTVMWDRASGRRQLALPAAHFVEGIAISPSGRTIAVHTKPNQGLSRGTVRILDAATGQERATHRDRGEPGSYINRLVLPSDDVIVLADESRLRAERRRLRDWRVTATTAIGSGNQLPLAEPAGDGSAFAAVGGSPTIPVWRMGHHGTVEHSDAEAEVPIVSFGTAAMSPDGTLVAAADSSSIYLARVGRPGGPHPPPITLRAPGRVAIVRFFGDNRHLISASGRSVWLWDLDQIDRLAQHGTIALAYGCSACSGPVMSPSPDGRSLAITDGAGGTAGLLSLPGWRARSLPRNSGRSYASLLWGHDGLPLFVIQAWEPANRRLPAPSLGKGVRAVVPAVLGSSESAGLSGDGHSVIAVDEEGRVAVTDVRSGKLRRQWGQPPGTFGWSGYVSAAAVHGGPDLVATVYGGRLRVFDIARGRTIGRVRIPGVIGLVYSKNKLLVQKATGELQVRSLDSERLERTLTGDAGYVFTPAVDSAGTLVARLRVDGSVTLSDLSTGAILATLPPISAVAGAKSGVALASDGQAVYTATFRSWESRKATVIRRDLQPERLVRTACATIGRDLTSAEWRQFVGTPPPDDLRCR